MRELRWDDLTAEVGPLVFPHGTMRLIDGPRTFRLYLREHRARREPPRVDFDRRLAFVVAVGPRSTTGHEVRVLRVTEQRRRVLVVAEERTPGLRARVRARLDYPYRLITIPRRTDKPVVAEIEGRP